MIWHYQFILISKGSGQSVPGLSLMTFCDVLLLSRAPFLHNEGVRHLRQRRTPQMDARHALTRYSQFVPV